MTEPGRHVIVAGGGIAGLTVALSLHQAGIAVDVYEAAAQIRPLGVGINLQPLAVRELDALGVMDAVAAQAVAPGALLYVTRHGQEIWRQPRGLSAGYPWPQLSVHRGELHMAFLEAVIDRVGTEHVHTAHRLDRVDDTDRPRAVFSTAEGEVTVSTDAVLGADGIHSALRRQFWPEEGPPVWNGALLWRGLATVPQLLDGRTMVWAGHADQKFVAYPVADLPDGRQHPNFIAELRRPVDTTLSRREDWNRPGVLYDFLPEFESWTFDWLDVPATITSAEATYLFPMVDRDPVPCWTVGSTTLVGDAAHPMYPIGSNGASQAILDARIVAACLQHGPGDVPTALRRYEELRRPATSALVHANRRLGPELPMNIVEERAPHGFTDVNDVISPEEIAEVTRDYRSAARLLL